MERYKILVDCADGYGFRSYGTYVGYEYNDLKALANGLPDEWDYEIEKD